MTYAPKECDTTSIMTYEEAIGFDELYKSSLKCKSGVMWKDSTIHFTENAITEVAKLSDELKRGVYTSRKPYCFVVTHPKRRDIISVSFRDRVYQRSLNDNIIYPAMTKSFILDNYACQTGKGTDFARSRFKELLRRFYRKHGTDGYILQLDIKGYYPNMSHEYAEGLLIKKLDAETACASINILRSQYSGDKGYNPGSQLVQILGISALDKLDHAIKEKLHCKYYGRYMDDLFIIHHDKEFLKDVKFKIEKELESIQMVANKKKTHISAITSGVQFLGFDFRLTKSGKVLMLPSRKYVKQAKKHLRNMVRLSKSGKLPATECDNSLNLILSYMAKGDSYYCRRNIDRYYANLWSDNK